ncbi:hypothetical protein [Acetobacter senegalensis]|nr:hypothetical protein [Acetobacter senegalensis]
MVGLQVRKWRNQTDVLSRDVFGYPEHAKAKFFFDHMLHCCA